MISIFEKIPRVMQKREPSTTGGTKAGYLRGLKESWLVTNCSCHHSKTDHRHKCEKSNNVSRRNFRRLYHYVRVDKYFLERKEDTVLKEEN